jgi:hypothetical protein
MVVFTATGIAPDSSVQLHRTSLLILLLIVLNQQEPKIRINVNQKIDGAKSIYTHLVHKTKKAIEKSMAFSIKKSKFILPLFCILLQSYETHHALHLSTL